MATARTCYSASGIITTDMVAAKPDLRDRIAPRRAQIDLFETATAAAHGEL
ncbi:MAG: hypothetical protein F6K28_40675 [Microcoleus sp. SIO2G3]|nr:hypothetical protein [Microcoleus sp. SIO2G3]